MASSLFRQVTRYRVEERFNPSENRLTEVLAAVLQRVPSLAERLCLEWLGRSVDGGVRVATQVPTPSGGFVDAELTFVGNKGAPLVIWIENKHGAGLHGRQLETYQTDLSRLGCDPGSRLIVLAPSYATPEGAPLEMTYTWQAVAQLVQELARTKTTDPVQQWLLNEFHRYLKEEKLTDTEPLRAGHALALSIIPEASSVIDRIVELVTPQLEQGWGPLKGRNQRAVALQPRWRNFPVAPHGETAAPGWGSSAHFELTVRLDSDLLPEPRGGWAFFAGASYGNSADAPIGEDDRAWVAARSTQGFHLVGDRMWRLFRVLYPDQLLGEPTLEAQAERLRVWTCEAFRDLAAAPPPPRPQDVAAS